MHTQFATRMDAMKPSSIREMLKMTERPDVISFAGGLPAPELFPIDDICVAAERMFAECGSQTFQYGITEGVMTLRELIVAEMASRRVSCTTDDVQVTTGSQQALDLLGKIFLDPGDVILTETPTYLAAIQAFQCFQAKFQPVATDEQGIVPDAVDELAAKGKVRFLYVIPNFLNPSGRTLSIERHRQLVEIAQRRNLIIVEDDRTQ